MEVVLDLVMSLWPILNRRLRFVFLMIGMLETGHRNSARRREITRAVAEGRMRYISQILARAREDRNGRLREIQSRPAVVESSDTSSSWSTSTTDSFLSSSVSSLISMQTLGTFSSPAATNSPSLVTSAHSVPSTSGNADPYPSTSGRVLPENPSPSPGGPYRSRSEPTLQANSSSSLGTFVKGLIPVEQGNSRSRSLPGSSTTSREHSPPRRNHNHLEGPYSSIPEEVNHEEPRP